jgi:hypothetical protein
MQCQLGKPYRVYPRGSLLIRPFSLYHLYAPADWGLSPVVRGKAPPLHYPEASEPQWDRDRKMEEKKIAHRKERKGGVKEVRIDTTQRL